VITGAKMLRAMIPKLECLVAVVRAERDPEARRLLVSMFVLA
jgi:hypothetical protein